MYLDGTTGLRGLGALPPCSGVSVDAGFVGPMNCDPSGGQVNYGGADPNQTTLADPFGWFALDAGNPSGVLTPAGTRAPQTLAAWLNANALSLALALGAGALVIGMAKR